MSNYSPKNRNYALIQKIRHTTNPFFWHLIDNKGNIVESFRNKITAKNMKWKYEKIYLQELKLKRIIDIEKYLKKTKTKHL